MGTRLPYITCHLYRFHDWGSFFRRTGLTFLGLATRAQSLDISAPDQPDSALITVAHKCAATQFFLSAHQEIDPAGTDAPRGIRFNPNPRKQELRGELVHFGTGLDHGHKIGELLRVAAKTRGRRYPQSSPKSLQNGRKELNES